MKQKIKWYYFVIIFFSVLFTFIFHEFGHFILGEISGSQMRMNLIRAWSVGGFRTPFSDLFSSIGGPLFTVLQTAAVAFIIIKYKNIQMYPVLVAGLLARLIPNINVFINYNKVITEDEPHISKLMGYPNLTISLIVVSLLIGITFYTAYKLRMSIKFVLITFGSAIISTMIIFRISTLLGF